MIEKVIYINNQSLTTKYFYDYFLNECLKCQFEVEYWDLSRLYFPHLEMFYENEFNVSYRNINSLTEFKSLLKKNNLDTTVFITNITYEFRVWKLFFILSNLKCNLFFFARGMYPMPQENALKKILKLVRSFNLGRIILWFKNQWSILLKKYKFIKTYDVVFRAGTEGCFTIGYGSKYDVQHSEIIDINYFDYDKYLYELQQNNHPIINEKYCVFLDQYLANHPDIEICGLSDINPDIYFSELNNYFQFIESKYNLKVVIAAHPKAKNYQISNPFLGRQIIFDKTCELVKDSSFVLTHHSTAISFPILFEKPIIFLNSNELKVKMPDLHDLTCYLSSYLNSDIVNFDMDIIDNNLSLNVDKARYKLYVSKYLSAMGNDRISSSEIFTRKLKQYLCN